MHIPENYLSPATCGIMGAAMVPVWVHAVKKINKELPKSKIPLIGIGAALSFLGMMFNIPLIGGTTGHVVGGTLIAILFGPDAACIALSVALLLQAVIFGDGGILSYGANCFNMAFVLPYTGYAVYKALGKRSYIAAAAGAYISINLAALCAALEFGIQPLLFTDAQGNALYCPYDLSVSISAMTIPHLAVAGFAEAAFTLFIFAFVKKTAPDLLYENIALNNPYTKEKHIPVFALIALMIAASPLGLLAKGDAWGEWEIEGWSLSSLMPDYTAGGLDEKVAYILSAVIGASLLIIIFKLISIPMKGRRENDS